MAGGYTGVSNATNTVSTTVPMFTIVGAATGRLKLADFIVGSDVPNDYGAKFVFRRISARGTQSTTWAPNPADPGDSATARAVYDTAWSANPTITANSDLLQVPMNARATIRWAAVPGFELVVPATAGAGLALMSAVASTAQNFAFTSMWQE